MDTNTFIVHLKTEHVYKDIPEDIEKRFDTSNFEINRPLPLWNNKTVIGLMKGELSGLIMKRFVWLRAKSIYLFKDNNEEDKKAKGTKKYVTKRHLKFSDYKQCLKPSQIENRISYLENKRIDVDCPKKYKKELVKSKLILKKNNKDLRAKAQCLNWSN